MKTSLAAREQAKCPNRAAHNIPDFSYAGPDDEWLAANTQVKCDGCGYFVVVIPTTGNGGAT